ncbi:MAG: zeta toxin family protein [Deltaproteobacteria bacterium]|nr:zeta toxin family protein [Deltaproteobacteria bacterium]
MGSSDDRKRASGPARVSLSERQKGRIQVEDAGKRRPFMRGIMIHSLMARGIAFDEAFHAANEVRSRVGDRVVLEKSELAKMLREILGPEPFAEDPRVPLPGAEITVTGRGKGVPFSKGHLSQSLLAAALDPNDAFDVAREIERELVASGTHEVDRRDLRRMTFDVLTREVSPRAAERYLVWRKYQEPERPVIILLGGATGVGKTSLALEVAHRLGIGRVLSTDSIRQIMRIMLSQDLVPALHASSYDAHKLLPPESVGDDPVIDGFMSQAASVSVGVRASMDRAVLENASLVLDGVAIVPGLIDLEVYADLADVFFVMVSLLDEEGFETRFAERATSAKARPQHRYLKNLNAILRVQNHLLELADRHGVPIVDNVSFDSSVLQIVRHVTESLRKKGDFDAAEML